MRKRFCFKRQKRFLQFGILEEMLMYLLATPCPLSLICKFDNALLSAAYSGLNLNQNKATKPQTVQIVRQGEATPYSFKVNPLY